MYDGSSSNESVENVREMGSEAGLIVRRRVYLVLGSQLYL